MNWTEKGPIAFLKKKEKEEKEVYKKGDVWHMTTTEVEL